MLDTEHFDSILCIGTPTVFEYVKSQSHINATKITNAFLLDYDDRLVTLKF